MKDLGVRNSTLTHNIGEAKNKVNVKKKSKKDKTFIHFGHDNWNLVLHMLFGIR